MFSVADKIVCITGSSRGLGKALARGFAENGSSVIISSFDSEELEQVKNEFAADNLSVEAVVADVKRRQDCELLINSAIERFGKLDENDPYQQRVIAFTPMGRRGTRQEFLGA